MASWSFLDSFRSEISIDKRIEIVNVPIITANETQELCEKNSPTEWTELSSIFTPINKRMKLTPVFRYRNIPIIPLRAKKSEINPITAKTLDEMARKFSSLGLRTPFTPSLITPMIAGMESTANKTSVEPITSRARKILVMCV